VLQAEVEETFEPASYNTAYQYQTETRWHMRLTFFYRNSKETTDRKGRG